jgi:hypothetical protein
MLAVVFMAPEERMLWVLLRTPAAAPARYPQRQRCVPEFFTCARAGGGETSRLKHSESLTARAFTADALGSGDTSADGDIPTSASATTE